jgi:hypothetical protein
VQQPLQNSGKNSKYIITMSIKSFGMTASLIFLAVMLVSQQATDAFVSQGTRRTPACKISGSSPSIFHHPRKTLLLSTPGDNDQISDNNELLEKIAAVTETSPTLSTPSTTETTSYPIDLPSPILLATSMLLAIVGTGATLQLT